MGCRFFQERRFWTCITLTASVWLSDPATAQKVTGGHLFWGANGFTGFGASRSVPPQGLATPKLEPLEPGQFGSDAGGILPTFRIPDFIAPPSPQPAPPVGNHPDWSVLRWVNDPPANLPPDYLSADYEVWLVAGNYDPVYSVVYSMSNNQQSPWQVETFAWTSFAADWSNEIVAVVAKPLRVAIASGSKPVLRMLDLDANQCCNTALDINNGCEGYAADDWSGQTCVLYWYSQTADQKGEFAYKTNAPMKVSVEFADVIAPGTNEPKNALMIFQDDISTDYADCDQAQATTACYQGNAYYDATDGIALGPGEIAFIARDAWVDGFVYTTAQADGAEVRGAGVLSGAKNAKQDDSALKAPYMVELCGNDVKVTDLTVAGQQWEGVILNAYYGNYANCNDLWTTVANAVVNNIKIVAAFPYETDGILVGNKGVVYNSFIQSNDDALKPFFDGNDFQSNMVWQGDNGWTVNLGWNQGGAINSAVVSDLYVVHVGHLTDAYCGYFKNSKTTHKSSGQKDAVADFSRGDECVQSAIEQDGVCELYLTKDMNVGQRAVFGMKLCGGSEIRGAQITNAYVDGPILRGFSLGITPDRVACCDPECGKNRCENRKTNPPTGLLGSSKFENIAFYAVQQFNSRVFSSQDLDGSPSSCPAANDYAATICGLEFNNIWMGGQSFETSWIDADCHSGVWSICANANCLCV